MAGEFQEQSPMEQGDEAKWYVIHTYSGHENKVKDNIESMVKNQNLEDMIYEVQVPMEEYHEVKDGVTRAKERKMFPSYVLIKMVMNDRSWYLVRNTRGVTGFVAPGSGNVGSSTQPVPLSEDEVRALGVANNEDLFGDFEVGDTVRILNGPFQDLIGNIIELDFDKAKVKVSVMMLGTEAMVELDFNQLISAV